jgi:hypothetical protein
LKHVVSPDERYMEKAEDLSKMHGKPRKQKYMNI